MDMWLDSGCATLAKRACGPVWKQKRERMRGAASVLALEDGDKDALPDGILGCCQFLQYCLLICNSMQLADVAALQHVPHFRLEGRSNDQLLLLGGTGRA